jgi:hypothetical protein
VLSASCATLPDLVGLSCCTEGMTFCWCPADFDQEKIKDGWKNIQVVQALKPVPGNGQVHDSSWCAGAEHVR